MALVTLAKNPILFVRRAAIRVSYSSAIRRGWPYKPRLLGVHSKRATTKRGALCFTNIQRRIAVTPSAGGPLGQKRTRNTTPKLDFGIGEFLFTSVRAT